MERFDPEGVKPRWGVEDRERTGTGESESGNGSVAEILPGAGRTVAGRGVRIERVRWRFTEVPKRQAGNVDLGAVVWRQTVASGERKAVSRNRLRLDRAWWRVAKH